MMGRAWLLVAGLLAAPAWAKDGADAGTSGASAVQRMDAAQFKAALAKAQASGKKFVLLDVREPNETAAGAVKGAELMPYTSGAFARDHGSIPKNEPVFLYCASGRRAGRAADILASEGWTNVTVLSDGGYEDLKTLPAR
jgi:phage shock protein E